MTTELLVALGAAAAAGAAFFIVGRWAERRTASRAHQSARDVAERLLADARRDAESFRQTLLTTGTEEIARARAALEEEVVRRRDEVTRGERRLEERERQLERKVDLTERREEELQGRLTAVAGLEQKVAAQEQELRQIGVEQRRRLEAL